MQAIKKQKRLLYLGLGVLTTGLIMRIILSLSFIPNLLIIIGVVCKISYLLKQIIAGKYKVGVELVVLLVGLILFFIGIYLKYNGKEGVHLLFVFPGIILKLLFIILFIRKVNK